jgi:glycosyltransferase involved in cell wall biosynthesis
MSIDFRGFDKESLPLVSVYALCYNHEKFIEFALNSIKSQTYPNIQLIIMDDFSSDHSVDIIKKWIEINEFNCTFIKHSNNLGVCKTLNEALSYCEGDYYMGLSCDDFIFPDKIEKQVHVLRNTSDEVAMVFSDVEYFDENNNDLYGLYIQHHRQFLKIPSGWIFDDLIAVNFIPAFSVLIKRKVFEIVGTYDESLDYEDTDMWIRIAKKFEIIFVDIIAGKYRVHSNNMTKSTDFGINIFKYCLKHVNESRKAKEMMLKVLINSYWGNHKQLSYMRKVYFSITNKPRILNYFIMFRVPYVFYYVFSKLFKFNFRKLN